MRLAVLLGVGLLAVAVDQASKQVALRRVSRVRRSRVGLVLTDNARGTWARLTPRGAVLLLGVLTAWCVGVVLVVDRAGLLVASGLGLSLGSAASNLADRARRGAVVDFVAVGPWPIFNLADAGLVAGVALSVWGLV